MGWTPLLFARAPLSVVGMRITPQGLELIAESTSDGAACPTCGVRSRRVHSRYRRIVQDLPAFGRLVRIELHLCRFFCDRSDCPQRTFAERLPTIATAHARKTPRLIDALTDIAFTAGGEAGSRLAGKLDMASSGDTLLRLLHKTTLPMANTAPQVLGVDDFALRRGQVYGTILCDLEHRRPVDLLPERTSTVFAAWLKDHPGTRIISRDRASDYAKGASVGAPDAVQVADRWHLLHNLTEALQRAVDSHQALLGEVTKEVATALAPVPKTASSETLPPVAPPETRSEISAAASSLSPTRFSRADQKKQESRQRRLARYQQVKELRRQGMGTRKIARTLHMSRNTVERFAACQEFPERATPMPRPLPIDVFLPYLQRRWEEGCDNVTELWQEITTQGFTGSVYTVRRQIGRWRRAAGVRLPQGRKPTMLPRIIRPSARRIAWLALGHVRQPTAQDELILQAMYRRWPQLQETAELCRQFAGLLKEHDVNALEAWAQLAQEEGIVPEVQRFAEVLRQDWAAVVEAVRQPWSQGQTEGQINRLKLIKRQMYGRGSFELLRQRVLHAKPA